MLLLLSGFCTTVRPPQLMAPHQSKPEHALGSSTYLCAQQTSIQARTLSALYQLFWLHWRLSAKHILVYTIIWTRQAAVVMISCSGCSPKTKVMVVQTSGSLPAMQLFTQENVCQHGHQKRCMQRQSDDKSWQVTDLLHGAAVGEQRAAVVA